MLKMIVATDEKGGIGVDGKLPWDCPEDLAFFRDKTLGKSVIMGRTTFESLPSKKGLPRRKNYVLTSDPDYGKDIEGVYFYTDIAKLIYDVVSKGEDAFVMGGASIYEQFLPFTLIVYKTVIKGEYMCDTFFPKNNMLEGEDFQESGIDFISDRAYVATYTRIYYV